MTRDDGRSLIVSLELEFTAVTPELIEAKLSTYLKALEAGEIIVSVWLFKEHHVHDGTWKRVVTWSCSPRSWKTFWRDVHRSQQRVVEPMAALLHHRAACYGGTD